MLSLKPLSATVAQIQILSELSSPLHVLKVCTTPRSRFRHKCTELCPPTDLTCYRYLSACVVLCLCFPTRLSGFRSIQRVAISALNGSAVDLDRLINMVLHDRDRYAQQLAWSDFPDVLQLGDVFTVIRDMDIVTPAHFEEVLDGAGGAFNLGHLIVGSMRLFVPRHRHHVSDEQLAFLTDILLFVQKLGHNKIMLPALMENAGSTTITLTAAACSGLECEPKRAAAQGKLVLLCLNTLSRLLACHGAMRECGLLYTIFYCATIRPNSKDPSETRGLKQLLSQTLPASTMFQDVLEELDIRLQSLKPLSERADFQKSWMQDDWLKFTAIAHDRIAFMKRVQSSDFISFKACDNMECGMQAPERAPRLHDLCHVASWLPRVRIAPRTRIDQQLALPASCSASAALHRLRAWRPLLGNLQPSYHDLRLHGHSLLAFFVI
ncbi:hypothetical protein C8R45DRAFT_1098845 [Mycena sanguinolenta]|nr:hypothetical protein C8R45DRAFT_1098845 [Mycena sanguinolenta]